MSVGLSVDRSREDWIRAAGRRLAQGGAAAVAVEALARDLGVTKGSFYWHFRDRAALSRL
jgi:AcrR family transcriptional regulator